MSNMAEVLAAHQFDREKAVCTCSNEVQVGLRCDKQTHAEHVADELAKAGYGKLAEARAAELEAAADDYRHYETPNARIYLRDRAAAIQAGEA